MYIMTKKRIKKHKRGTRKRLNLKKRVRRKFNNKRRKFRRSLRKRGPLNLRFKTLRRGGASTLHKKAKVAKKKAVAAKKTANTKQAAHDKATKKAATSKAAADKKTKAANAAKAKAAAMKGKPGAQAARKAAGKKQQAAQKAKKTANIAKNQNQKTASDLKKAQKNAVKASAHAKLKSAAAKSQTRKKGKSVAADAAAAAKNKTRKKKQETGGDEKSTDSGKGKDKKPKKVCNPGVVLGAPCDKLDSIRRKASLNCHPDKQGGDSTLQTKLNVNYNNRKTECDKTTKGQTKEDKKPKKVCNPGVVLGAPCDKLDSIRRKASLNCHPDKQGGDSTLQTKLNVNYNNRKTECDKTTKGQAKKEAKGQTKEEKKSSVSSSSSALIIHPSTKHKAAPSSTALTIKTNKLPHQHVSSVVSSATSNQKKDKSITTTHTEHKEKESKDDAAPTKKKLGEPCSDPVDCITGICYADKCSTAELRAAAEKKKNEEASAPPRPPPSSGREKTLNVTLSPAAKEEVKKALAAPKDNLGQRTVFFKILLPEGSITQGSGGKSAAQQASVTKDAVTP